MESTENPFYTFEPIGYLAAGGGSYPQEAPRQAVYAGNAGRIELLPGRNFEQALADLVGFDRIWLIFVFDRNRNWKPKVMPPNGSRRKRGVFATRSPHRPNPIGMSAVELAGVSGRTLYIRNFDLLDGTPILDIKPYIPAADAFPDAAAGWRDEQRAPQRKMRVTPAAERAAHFIQAHGGPDLVNAARVQLCTRDCDPARQRIAPAPSPAPLSLPAPSGDEHILAFRTWRIRFRLTAGDEIEVTAITSGYPPQELVPGADDPYRDKELHRAFQRWLNSETGL